MLDQYSLRESLLFQVIDIKLPSSLSQTMDSSTFDSQTYSDKGILL